MDQSLLLIINREWTNPFLDRLMAIMSSIGFWMPLLAIAAVFLAIFGGFRGRALLFAAGMCILFVDGITVNFGKGFVQRPRPGEAFEGVRQVDLANATPRFMAATLPLVIDYSAPGVTSHQGRSFPSGHAANNFAIATVIAVFYRRWGWLYFIPSVLVAYSRVYVGSHWPSDVIISSLLGSGISLLVMSGLQVLWQKTMSACFPKFYIKHPKLIPT